jgi:hypothetical protein
MNREAPYKTRPIGPLFTKQGSRIASAVTGVIEGPGEPQAKTMPRKKSKPSREIIRKGKTEESFDLYDLILAHLLDEGYANTVENAEAIILNMSEDWVECIIENTVMATKSPQPTTMNNQSAKPKADPKANPTAKPAPSMRDRFRTTVSAFSKGLQQY